MENPIGPLITQLGMGWSFVSQHLKVTQKYECNSYVNIIYNSNKKMGILKNRGSASGPINVESLQKVP